MRQYRIITKGGRFYAQTRPGCGWPFWSTLPRLVGAFAWVDECSTHDEAAQLIEKDRIARLPKRVVG